MTAYYTDICEDDCPYIKKPEYTADEFVDIETALKQVPKDTYCSFFSQKIEMCFWGTGFGFCRGESCLKIRAGEKP